MKMRHTLHIPRLGTAFMAPTVGLYGGSFNPVHEGHLHVAQTALKALGLHRVVWLVSPHNPLKQAADLADYQTRLEGAKAFARNPKFYVSDAEAVLGTQYSMDTVTRLQALYPRTRFVFVMGADSFASLHLWKDWRGLMDRVPMAVVSRPGYGRAALLSRAAQYRARVSGRQILTGSLPRWCYIGGREHSASSTALRLARTAKHARVATGSTE